MRIGGIEGWGCSEWHEWIRIFSGRFYRSGYYGMVFVLRMYLIRRKEGILRGEMESWRIR